MYIERNLIYTHDFKMFLADLSCISYWTDGRGAWYVAWTLPVYLFYPLYHHLASKAKKYRWTISGTGLVIITLVCAFLEMNQNAALIRFASPIGATIAFLIGDAFADLVKSNRKNVLLILCIGFLIAPLYLLDILCGGTVYVWFFALCGISLCALCGILAEIMPDIVVKRFIGRCGSVSLEIYLFNLYYIGIGDQLFREKTTIYGFFVYLGIIIATILSAFFFAWIRNKMEKK